jgi:hypothetical protein
VCSLDSVCRASVISNHLAGSDWSPPLRHILGARGALPSRPLRRQAMAAGTRRDRLARSMAPGIRPHVESIDSRKSTGDRSARDAERCGMESRAGSADRSSMARPPTRRRVPPTRRWRGHPHHSTDARAWDHSTDAALSQRDGRRTQERTGGELEQQRPTASTRIRSLKSSTATRSLVGLPRRHPFVTQRLGDARSLVAGARNQHYLQLWRPAA